MTKTLWVTSPNDNKCETTTKNPKEEDFGGFAQRQGDFGKPWATAKVADPIAISQ
jgi:hypothetical protein